MRDEPVALITPAARNALIQDTDYALEGKYVDVKGKRLWRWRGVYWVMVGSTTEDWIFDETRRETE